MASYTATDKETVVLLDSDPAVRSQIRHIASRNRFTVYSAMTRGQAARMLMMRENIGVALVGVSTSKMDEVMATLDQLEKERPELCVIALVDMNDTDVVVKLMRQERIYRYLQKPLIEKDFMRDLKSALNHHKILKNVGDASEVNAKPAEKSKRGGLFNFMQSRSA